MTLIEAIAVIRDVVIIVFGLVTLVTVIFVGRAVLDLIQKYEALRADVETNVVNPVKRGLQLIGRAVRLGRPL